MQIRSVLWATSLVFVVSASAAQPTAVLAAEEEEGGPSKCWYASHEPFGNCQDTDPYPYTNGWHEQCEPGYSNGLKAFLWAQMRCSAYHPNTNSKP